MVLEAKGYNTSEGVTLEVIGGKWKCFILFHMMNGNG